MMRKYTVTVYEKNGEKLLEDIFEAANDKDARQAGETFLEEKGYQSHTSRVTSDQGKLIHFHR